MSLIVVQQPAESRKLATLSQLKGVLGITTTSQDDLLNDALEQASSMVEDYTDRTFVREVLTEKLDLFSDNMERGTHITRLMVSRTPILMIEEIRFDGADIDLQDVELEDPHAGFIFREKGFTDTNLVHQGINRTAIRATEPLWEVDYTAGFITNDLPDVSASFGSGDVDADADTITITDHGLKSGDPVRFITDGTLPMPLQVNRDFFVTDVTRDTFKVAMRRGGMPLDITDSGSGTHTVNRTVTLPPSLQRDVIELATFLHQQNGRDPTISRERLGDWGASFRNSAGASGIPPNISSRLDRWRNPASV